MSEKGFAISVTNELVMQAERLSDVVAAVFRILQKNYLQAVDREEVDSYTRPLLLCGPKQIYMGQIQWPYAWYVNTEAADQIGPPDEGWELVGYLFPDQLAGDNAQTT